MDIDEQLPILLKVEINDDELKLRLDKKGLGNFELDGDSIQQIILSGCEIDKKLIDELWELKTEVFEHEIYKQDNKIVFQFWGDYGRIEHQLECQSISENLFKYTETDLVQKGKTLFESYSDLHKRFNINFKINKKLKDKLQFEINNEIERFQRKAKFFEGKDKSKSDAFQSEIKVLKKLQLILDGNFSD